MAKIWTPNQSRVNVPMVPLEKGGLAQAILDTVAEAEKVLIPLDDADTWEETFARIVDAAALAEKARSLVSLFKDLFVRGAKDTKALDEGRKMHKAAVALTTICSSTRVRAVVAFKKEQAEVKAKEK